MQNKSIEQLLMKAGSTLEHDDIYRGQEVGMFDQSRTHRRIGLATVGLSETNQVRRFPGRENSFGDRVRCQDD